MINLNEIRTALEKQEFFLEYMPTVSLEDNRCVGAEALIRWRRDTQILMPMEFIPLIENTPLSGSVTYWVMDTVARELGSWLQEHKGIRIGINVPPEILGRGGLEYAARASNLLSLADRLMLEVTERGIPDTLGVRGINEACKYGVQTALDDVDVNDANLFVLSRIHTDVVKFDKSFVDQIHQADWSPEKMKGVAALIHAGNIMIIAEGVETARQAEILKNAGIQMAQGWYFSPSLSASDFIAYFSAHH